jgi:hypothetical protein
MEKIIISALLFLGLTSCLKEEVQINYTPNTGGLIAEAAMGSDYSNQLYYNLQKNEFVGNNNKLVWDFGFTLLNQDIILFANGSKLMRVSNFGPVEFANKLDTLGFSAKAKIENEDGIAFEKNAFGPWSPGDLFLMDRGFNSIGSHLGFWKMKIIKSTSNTVELSIGEISNTSPIRTFELDSTHKFYSLDNLSTVLVEPLENEWDLIFTQYTEYFSDDNINYLVTGCLLNRGESSAVLLEDGTTWENVDFHMAQSVSWSKKRNTIGYDWKHFDGSSYQIEQNKIYLIKDRHGLMYKLRFVSFYNQQGEKGHPRFEVVKF